MMDNGTIFSKTGKGLMEIRSKTNRLPKDPFRVLTLVDGKATLRDLVQKSQITEIELRKNLTLLSDAGFIKALRSRAAGQGATSAANPTPHSYDLDDLDFTEMLGPSAPAKRVVNRSAAPAIAQSSAAEHEASETAAVKSQHDVARSLTGEADTLLRVESERRPAEEKELERRAREKLETEMCANEQTEFRVRDAAEREARNKAEASAREESERRRVREEEAERSAYEKRESEKRVNGEMEQKAGVAAERQASSNADASARMEAENRRLQEQEQERLEEREAAQETYEQASATHYQTLDFTDAPALDLQVSSEFNVNSETLKRAEAEVANGAPASGEATHKAVADQAMRVRREEDACAALDRADGQARVTVVRDAHQLPGNAQGAWQEDVQRTSEEAIRLQQAEEERRALAQHKPK